MKVLRRTYFIYFLIPYKEVLWWDTPGWVGRVRATVIGDTFHNKTISKRHTQIFISKQSQKDIHKYLSPNNLQKDIHKYLSPNNLQKDIHKYLSPNNLNP